MQWGILIADELVPGDILSWAGKVRKVAAVGRDLGLVSVRFHDGMTALITENVVVRGIVD